MEINFLKKGECHVHKKRYIQDLIAFWPKLKDGKAETPSSSDLFKRRKCKLLSEVKWEIMHSAVAKSLYIANKSRPDIFPTASVLCGRARDATTDDWNRCERLVKYFNGTQELHLILWYNRLSIVKWYADASFGVHIDFKSRSWGLMLLSPDDGAIASGSTKQRLNVWSSIEAELVATDDFLPKLL